MILSDLWGYRQKLKWDWGEQQEQKGKGEYEWVSSSDNAW